MVIFAGVCDACATVVLAESGTAVSVFAALGSGRKSILHFGQLPFFFDFTSGCIGQE